MYFKRVLHVLLISFSLYLADFLHQLCSFLYRIICLFFFFFFNLGLKSSSLSLLVMSLTQTHPSKTACYCFESTIIPRFDFHHTPISFTNQTQVTSSSTNLLLSVHTKPALMFNVYCATLLFRHFHNRRKNEENPHFVLRYRSILKSIARSHNKYYGVTSIPDSSVNISKFSWAITGISITRILSQLSKGQPDLLCGQCLSLHYWF